MTKPRPRPLVRYVYVIGPRHGLQKVGMAVDPEVRLAALQTASPFDLILHAAVRVPFRDAHTVERAAHARLVGVRVRSEWFETSPAEAIYAVHWAAAPFIGKETVPPDPKVIWPSVASWRIERDRGLPLFDHSRLSSCSTIKAHKRLSWWAKLGCRG